ncbi:hypothetical protein [Nostoc sp.]|uniref:hypothetical protein n=1 Tax=Nostoc sp. TaxID=1180 RepID=UPI002FF6705B
MNILIILAEISLVILVFLLINWLLGKLFKLFTKISILKSEDRSIKTLRRNITGLLLLTCLVSCILIVGTNGYLVYRGENLQQYILLLIERIPSIFWVTLGIGIAQSIGTLILAAIALKFLKYWLKVASTRAKNLEKNTADDKSIDAFFSALYHRISGGIPVCAESTEG